MKKRLSALAIALVACASLLPAPSAHAGLWAGACLVEVNMTFYSPVRLTGTHPNYDISLSSFLPNTCPVTPLDGDVLDPLRSAGGSGSGSSIEWSCSAVASSGANWEQGFTDSSGNQSPPRMTGISHVMTGTWDDWQLVLNKGVNFVGVAHLRLSPFEQLKTVNCLTGSFNTLRMIGLMIFEDPEV